MASIHDGGGSPVEGLSSTPREHVDRQGLTAATFVELIDTLVDDFDVIDTLTVLASRCVQLLDAAAAGILLADTSGQLRVMAASTEANASCATADAAKRSRWVLLKSRSRRSISY